jgi:imidazoleglycerol-phosphate dehydratase
MAPGVIAPDNSAHVSLRLDVVPTPPARVATGVPVLDHLVVLLAARGSFDLALEIAPGNLGAEVAAAGRALGEALAPVLRQPGARGFAASTLPAGEALALVAAEVSDTPSVHSNVDLSSVRVGGLGRDLVASFLGQLAEGAGITLHVRLLEGEDDQHVLDAIFKALGAALGAAAAVRSRKE